MRTNDLAKKTSLYIVGIMNGTSIDGVDYVYCRIKKIKQGSKKDIQIEFVSQESVSFDPNIKNQLKKAAEHKLNVSDLSLLHHQLGRLYVQHLKKIQKKKKWKMDAIGLHGQTVFHAPPAATLQIGESSYLSAEFAIPVICDFRTADLALGGEGAPIASLFHHSVFQKQFQKKSISLHNLGGISNLSWMNAKGQVEKAFDTGPANILIDQLVAKITKGKNDYDENGQMAAQGLPAVDLIERVIHQTKYFQQKPPKSCGREEFGDQFLNYLLKILKPLSPQDQMASLVELTAKTISLSYQKFCPHLPEAIILCGGGAKNSYLFKRIQYHLPQVKVLSTEQLGWPVSAIEGGAFALLAAFKIWQIPSNIPKTTGARKAVPLGKVIEVF